MKEKFAKLFKIQLLNFFIIFLLHILFFLITPKSSLIYSNLFLVLSALSNAFMFTFLLILINIPFVFLGNTLQKIILFVTNFIVFVFIFVDFAIFRIYNFHFNGMVIGMITTPGFWDSVSLGFSTILLFVLVILSIVLIEYFIVNYWYNKIKFRHLIYFYILCILFTAFEKIGYAISDIYNLQSITRFTKTYPLYQPLTVRGFAKKILKIDVNKEDGFKITKSLLHYPKNKLNIAKPDKKLPNIIVIAIDSLRFDMINDEVSPNINMIRKKSYDFANHYSGGNSTRFGIFSLFYGLYGYYWHDFLNNRQGTVLFDALKEAGYDFKILSATLLTFPEFRKTAFIKIPDSIEDTFDTNDSTKREHIVLERFIKYRDSLTSEKPYFSFIFFDAPHARKFPKEFNKFKSSGKDANYLIIGKNNITDIKNAYMNSVYFDDFLVGKLYNYLEKKGDLKNTIIVITGDHGEEFYEQGHFGHNNSFGKYQTKVPFIVYLPEKGYKKISSITTHYDFVPTILSMVGVKNDYKDYSFGTNLFEPEKRDYVVSCNWSNCGIIDNESVLYFSYETHKSFNMTVYDENYKEVTDKNFINEKKKRLNKIIKEFTYFYK